MLIYIVQVRNVYKHVFTHQLKTNYERLGKKMTLSGQGLILRNSLFQSDSRMQQSPMANSRWFEYQRQLPDLYVQVQYYRSD